VLPLSKIYPYKGFSLIELLVIIAVLATVLLISFKPTNQINLSLQTATNSVTNAFQLAKIYSISHNVDVVFCIQKNRVCQDTKNWHDNWLIFVDKNANSKDKGNYDANEKILLDGITISDKVKIASNVIKITFKSNGRMSSGTLSICSKLSKAIQWVVFHYGGRYRISLNEDDHLCP
jgi:Tfp pilus assembly protein FimT